MEKKITDTEIWGLRARGYSVQRIVSETGYSQAKVYASLHRVAEEYQVEHAADIIKLELDRLDIMLAKAMEALDRTYIAYSHGKMMRDEDDNAVEDTGPVMKAIDTVLKIMDRRSRYLGLDAPSKSEQSINVHSTSSPEQLALLKLVEEFKQNTMALTPEALEQAALPQIPQTPASHQPQPFTLDGTFMIKDEDLRPPGPDIMDLVNQRHADQDRSS